MTLAQSWVVSKEVGKSPYILYINLDAPSPEKIQVDAKTKYMNKWKYLDTSGQHTLPLFHVYCEARSVILCRLDNKRWHVK